MISKTWSYHTALLSLYRAQRRHRSRARARRDTQQAITMLRIVNGWRPVRSGL